MKSLILTLGRRSLMNYNYLKDKRISVQVVFYFTLFIYICMLYTFYEYRLPILSLTILIFVYYFISRKKKLSLFFVWNFLFVLLCAFSLFWSYNYSQTVIEVRNLLWIGIINNLIIAFIDDKEKINIIFKMIIFSGLVYILRLIYEFPLDTWLSGRLGGTGDFNSNRIGMYLSISGLAVFHFALMKNNKHYYLLLPVFVGVVFLTGSRKAFLMLIMGIGLLYYFNRGRNIQKKISALITAIVITIIFYFLVMNISFLYDILGHRIESIFSVVLLESGNLDYSSRLRSQMVDIGMDLFAANPILGSGIGSYTVLSGFSTYSHNNYIELLVGLGITGVVVYYGFVLYIVLKLVKEKSSPIRNLLLVLSILFLIIDYGLVSYNGPLYQLIIALGYSGVRILKKEIN